MNPKLVRRIIDWWVIFLILILDWTALHDILKGEPNLDGEYATLIGSGLILMGLIIKKELNFKLKERQYREGVKQNGR